MAKHAKSQQLQLRVSAHEKAAIQRAARQAGVDMSTYVLARVLAPAAGEFQDLTNACLDASSVSFALADLHAWLVKLRSSALTDAVASPPARGLPPYAANYIAAMVEYACWKKGQVPPAWTRGIVPLAEPVFASSLQSLRLHLLVNSPPPFRRRNIFVDTSVGGQV